VVVWLVFDGSAISDEVAMVLAGALVPDESMWRASGLVSDGGEVVRFLN
jgi:hypothetical protein